MTIIKRDIKKVFAELEAIEHEMILIDYSSFNDEFIIRARIVHLNSMSLHFMFNDRQITINTFITEQKEIENFASNIAANNDRSMNFMNIATIISEKDFMNIATIINEKNFINVSRLFNEKDIIVVTQNQVDNIVMTIDAERLRRKTLLKRITALKDSNSSKSKKLTLKNLSAKFRKSLRNQTLEKLRSSREEEDMKIEINERTYHVDMIIKHLHSCARFFLRNSKINLLVTSLAVGLGFGQKFKPDPRIDVLPG
jgi:hypothetical protein